MKPLRNRIFDLKARTRSVVLFIVDIALVFVSYFASIYVCYRGFEPYGYPIHFWHIFVYMAVYAAFLIGYGVYNSIWRYAQSREYFVCYLASVSAGCMSFILKDRVLLDSFGEREHINFYCYAIFILATATGITGIRILYRFVRDVVMKRDYSSTNKRLMIVGAGSAAATILNEICTNRNSGYTPIAIVDDDAKKVGRSINQVRIVGTSAQIPALCKKYNIDSICIAIPSATADDRKHLLQICAETNCQVKMLPYFSEMESSVSVMSEMKDITVEDLLGRPPITVANEKILGFVKGKTVVVTGGGGSIGSEICRQIAAHQPNKLVIIDIYENNAYAIQQELIRKYGSMLKLDVLIASVRDYDRINEIFAEEKPDVVFHAAAHKHVPLMEYSPQEAVKNNIGGTYNTARAAIANNVRNFILISTDKAVNPTNIMGATKRACEMIIQMLSATTTTTTLAAVRFGNVLGSNGSVVPLFKDQIKSGGPVTVTHPDMTRFFMTISEASQLVITAGAMARGGEIFVLDMGQPVKIDDLARQMIKLSGLKVGVDIDIKYVGLRPGEKLYEELLMNEEGLRRTDNDKIFIGHPIELDADRFASQLHDIVKYMYDNPAATPKDVETQLMALVPTFKRVPIE